MTYDAGEDSLDEGEMDLSTAKCSDTDRVVFNSNLLNSFSIEFEQIPQTERNKLSSGVCLNY